MTRIRKRPSITTSSLKPEVHATSNGGLQHLGAGPQSNPSFQDARQSLLCASSGVKKDSLLLVTVANSSGNSDFSADEAKKQLPATPAALYSSKPYISVPSGNTPRENEEGLRTKVVVRDTKLRDMDVPQHGGKHMHIHDDGGNETCNIGNKVTKEPGLAANRAFYERQGEGSETACIERAIKHGSVQSINELGCADPTDTEDGPFEHPRKVLPLELILNSESRLTAAAKARSIPSKEPRTADHERMMPSSSSTSTPCRTPRLTGKPQDKGWDGVAAEQRASPLQRAQPLSFMKTESESSDVKIQGESKSTREERASSDQSLDWPVSSWQGHRRARSFLQGGRLANDSPRILAGRPGVNSNFNPHENLQSSRILKEVKIYPVEKNACPQTKKKPLHIKTVESLPQKNISSAAGDGSNKRKRHTAAAQENDDYVHSASPAESSDHVIHADSMRCRRKDGRRWRCKDQVVKPGAPFCHYHTLKMREKHATSVARRLAKRQSERNGELTRSRPVGRKRRRNLLKSPALQDGYGRALMQGTAREEEDDNNDEDDHGEQEREQDSEEEESSDSRRDEQVAVKQEVQNLNSRWRKKCKPCIRRLHDIQDRPRPAVGEGLDYGASSSVWVVHTPTPAISSLKPPPSPLPECHLNTDPYEWRSDFP